MFKLVVSRLMLKNIMEMMPMILMTTVTSSMEMTTMVKYKDDDGDK